MPSPNRAARCVDCATARSCGLPRRPAARGYPRNGMRWRPGRLRRIAAPHRRRRSGWPPRPGSIPGGAATAPARANTAAHRARRATSRWLRKRVATVPPRDQFIRRPLARRISAGSRGSSDQSAAMRARSSRVSASRNGFPSSHGTCAVRTASRSRRGPTGPWASAEVAAGRHVARR